ncbi:HAD hydrolase-like protein [Methylobacterium planeticum]|uniref:HAD hydrolase-like protein n=1 Tax=Methylobacterium planeticum TaxID=2615211 RepID=A0A6N6MZH9_9HYPH|nr:HAD hydrolase-like protein [Methylobacterium planeticum]KAB1075075.1 HAD hydrolase-like protein [Methylobacterium planeticum]
MTGPANSPGAPPRYRLVILDFDGTLADTFPWFCGVINDVADRYRFRRVAEHETEALRGLGARAIIAHLGVPRWKLPAIARHMHALAARDIAGLRLFPGIDAMLDGLEAGGVRLAVVSSNTEANIRQGLGARNAGRIEDYACGAALFGKARRLRAVIRRSGVAPGAVLSIGDEIRDAEAAAEVGCGFGAVAWGYTRADALAALKPDHLFADPAEIVAAALGASPAQAPGVGLRETI